MASGPIPLRYVTWYACAGGAIAVGPWLALHLRGVGLTSSDAALVLLALPLGRLVGGPLWGWFADRVSATVVLRGATLLALGVAGGLLVATHPLALAILVLGWATAQAPAFPIMDLATVQRVGRRYGSVRASASASFLACVLLAGALRDHWGLAPIALAAGMSFLTAVVTFQLPQIPTPWSSPGKKRAPLSRPPSLRGWVSLFANPRLLPLLLASILHGMTLTSYDLLFASFLGDLGGSSIATGVALALGVAVEVGVLMTAAGWLERIGPLPLLTLGVAAGIPRFLVMGSVSSIPVLVGTQALHGLHFGAFWAGATALFAERAPPALRNSTQALLPASVYGVGRLLGLVFSAAWLQHGSSAGLYLAMAGVSAAASVLLLATAEPARRDPVG